MKKIVHNVSNGKVEEVDLSIAEIAEITAFQRTEAEKEAAPKPGEDVLALLEGVKNITDVRAILDILIRRVYALPAPVVDEKPVEQLAEEQGGIGATIRRALGLETES